MRIQVGKVVNADAEINLSDLSPLDRIIAATISSYRNTGLYKRRFAESEEQREAQRRRIQEALIDGLLASIKPEMVDNVSLAEKGDTCRGILVEVPSRYTPFIEEAIASHDFDAYNIVHIPPSKLLGKFANPPHLLYITNKGG